MIMPSSLGSGGSPAVVKTVRESFPFELFIRRCGRCAHDTPRTAPSGRARQRSNAAPGFADVDALPDRRARAVEHGAQVAQFRLDRGGPSTATGPCPARPLRRQVLSWSSSRSQRPSCLRSPATRSTNSQIGHPQRAGLAVEHGEIVAVWAGPCARSRPGRSPRSMSVALSTSRVGATISLPSRRCRARAQAAKIVVAALGKGAGQLGMADEFGPVVVERGSAENVIGVHVGSARHSGSGDR